MRSTSRAFCSTPLMTVALLCVFTAPAHAGMSDWMDKAFTFREEQKPLVTPHANSVPKKVLQPYYDDAHHATWSNFYTRPDLEPQDYLSSSASKVMRPRTDAVDQGGWDAVNARGNANASTNITIGDPGQGLGVLGSDSELGRKTVIGDAIKDWRDSNDGSLHSRAGDYDYRPADVNRPAKADINAIISEAVPPSTPMKKVNPATNPLRNDKRYVKFADDGQVIGYQVQGGDTLSNISGQPAIYGKEAMWPLIYSANRKAIGGSPKNLKVKQELVIPRDYTEQQAKEAMKKAK